MTDQINNVNVYSIVRVFLCSRLALIKAPLKSLERWGLIKVPTEVPLNVTAMCY